MGQQEINEPTQYVLRLSAFEIGILQGCLSFSLAEAERQEEEEAKFELTKLNAKLEVAFQTQRICQVNTILGKDEAL